MEKILCTQHASHASAFKDAFYHFRKQSASGVSRGDVWVSKHLQVIIYSLPNLTYGSLCGSITRSSNGRRPVKTQQTQESWAQAGVLATRTVHMASKRGSTVPTTYMYVRLTWLVLVVDSAYVLSFYLRARDHGRLHYEHARNVFPLRTSPSHKSWIRHCSASIMPCIQIPAALLV